MKFGDCGVTLIFGVAKKLGKDLKAKKAAEIAALTLLRKSNPKITYT